MNVDAKSTQQIRLIAQEVVAQQLRVCESERARTNDKVAQNAKDLKELDQTDQISAMREMWGEFRGEVRTQMRITWVLLFLILSSLVGVAFSVWGGKTP